MSSFGKCIIYLCIISVAMFLLGRLIPKKFFKHNMFPYKIFNFEKHGNIYNYLGVRHWKEKFPDMSRLFPDLVPSKRLPSAFTSEQIEAMIRETCVAEWTHSILSVLGFGCVFIWKNSWAWLLSVVYALGNLPYVIIQRYNRPKLERILDKQLQKENSLKA